MPRKPTLTENAAPVTIDGEATRLMAEDTAKAAVMAGQLNQIAERFDQGLPYERSRVVSEARFFMAQSAEAMLEAGRRLIVIKENEPHGEFVDIVEQQLGLASRTAQVMMQASLKYLSPKLEAKAQTFALLGKAKLLDLMVEEDDDLTALAEGGTVAGMTLTDIDRMSCRELKAALRKAREKTEADERFIDAKNKKIDELDRALDAERRGARPWPEKAAEILHEIGNYEETIEKLLLKLAEEHVALVALYDADHSQEGYASPAVRKLIGGRLMRAVGVVVEKAADLQHLVYGEYPDLIDKPTNLLMPVAEVATVANDALVAG